LRDIAENARDFSWRVAVAKRGKGNTRGLPFALGLGRLVNNVYAGFSLALLEGISV